MSKEKERYLQWGYESYRDTKTGEVRSDYVDLLNRQDAKISDLEAKLAEYEKQVEFYKERYSDVTTSAYGADLMAKNIQSRLEEEIRELKRQLAEKDEELKLSEEELKICNEARIILKEELAEKEKEIERLNNLYPLNEEKVKQIAVEEQRKVVRRIVEEETKKAITKDKTEFAIQQLQRVKHEIPLLAGKTEGKTFFVNYNQLRIFIDQIIKELEERRYEHK